jgi:hypothetical protein
VDLSDLTLLVVGALLSAYLLAVAIVRAIRPARMAGARVRNAVTAPFSVTFGEFDQESRLRQLEDEVRRALGGDDVSDSQARDDIVKAAVAAQHITILNQQLRKAVSQCLNTHWAVAHGSGAADMAEAARHPWCHRLRQRVVDLCDLLSTHLERYPLILDAPELIRLQLGIRRVAPQCIACPYFTTSVSDAPRICPTAKAFGYGRPSASGGTVVDGEVVDACRDDLQ